MAKLQNVLAHNASRLRMVMGKTQKQIAVMAGVSQKTISTLETQDSPISPRLATLEAVATSFKLHPAILLLEGITDEALTDREVGIMIEKFAALPAHRKRQIIEMIRDYHALEEAGKKAG